MSIIGRIKILPPKMNYLCTMRKDEVREALDVRYEDMYTERTVVLLCSSYYGYKYSDVEEVIRRLPKCNEHNCHIVATWNYAILHQCLPGAPILFICGSRIRNGKEALHEWVVVVDCGGAVHSVNGDEVWYDTISYIKP